MQTTACWESVVFLMVREGIGRWAYLQRRGRNMVDFQLGTMLFQIAAFLAFVFFFLLPGILVINSWKRLKRIEQQNETIVRLLRERSVQAERRETE